LLGFIALLFFFYNIANIPWGSNDFFKNIYNLYSNFAYFLLKEKLGIKGWLGVFVGL
jgi:drug/metabolite transporter (DMT)-like permease